MALDYSFPRKVLLNPKDLESAFRILTRILEQMQIEIKKALTDVYYTASGITLSNGTSTDALSDLQTYLDGNVYHIDEVSGVPGINLIVEFTNVKSISAIIIDCYYKGGAAHTVGIYLYNYSTTDWDRFTVISHGLDFEQYVITIVDSTNYMSNTNPRVAQLSFYHEITGIASHDLYIGYAGLKE